MGVRGSMKAIDIPTSVLNICQYAIFRMSLHRYESEDLIIKAVDYVNHRIFKSLHMLCPNNTKLVYFSYGIYTQIVYFSLTNFEKDKRKTSSYLIFAREKNSIV